MAKKYALLIGVDQYRDDHLLPLGAPAADVADFESILSRSDIGGFDKIEKLINESLEKVYEAIGALFAGKSRDDYALLTG